MKIRPLIGRRIRIVGRRGSVSVLSVDYVLTIISVKILHKCDETSLTVPRIAVRLTLKGYFSVYDFHAWAA